MDTTTLIAEINAQITELRKVSPDEADLFASDLAFAGDDVRELLMVRESLDCIIG